MNDLVLLIDGQQISGWNRIRVTRGIERLPNNFDITMSDLYPSDYERISIVPGTECRVLLNGDLVVTGYIDRVIPLFDVQRHEIRVTGRGACQDLVDCSAEWQGGQISGSNALQIAQKLAAPYGIRVFSDGNEGPSIPQFNFFIGETGYEIIERIARYAALLAFEDEAGNLQLARASTDAHASGFSQGANIESASYEWGADLRYSQIECYLQTMQTMGDTGANLVPAAIAQDATVRRPRKLYIVSEQVQAGRDIASERVEWENSIRAGRSQIVRVMTDSWRDGSGQLWTPNMLVPVTIPFLKVPDDTKLLIAEVSYLLDERGTHAEVVLLPPKAFAPEPLILQPLSPDVVLGAGS